MSKDKYGRERYSFDVESKTHPEYVEVYLIRYDTNTSHNTAYRVPDKYWLSDDYGVAAMTVIVKHPTRREQRKGIRLQDKFNSAVNKVRARANQLNESQKQMKDINYG